MLRLNDIGRWRRAVQLLCCGGLLIPTGCSKETAPRQFVARVDQSFLTEEELVAAHDTAWRTAGDKRQIVSSWVSTEVLYQEATRRGITNTDEFRRQAESARRQLAITALLDAELYGDGSPAVSEEDIVQAYKFSASQYVLKEDVVNISFARFSDRDAANEFRSKILRGSSWSEAVTQIESRPEFASALQQVATRQYFTQPLLYPEELWKLARTLSKETVSYVIKTPTGYYVLVLHSGKKQGEVPELAYVRDEVRDRLLIERRRMKYEQLVADLRLKHAVEVHLSDTDTSAGVKY